MPRSSRLSIVDLRGFVLPKNCYSSIKENVFAAHKKLPPRQFLWYGASMQSEFPSPSENINASEQEKFMRLSSEERRKEANSLQERAWLENTTTFYQEAQAIEDETAR